MDSNWIPEEANTGLEMIWPGKHIKQSEWCSEWNKNFEEPRYDYISDVERIFLHPVVEHDLNQEKWLALQTAKNKCTRLHIKNLAHFTSKDNAEKIIADAGFKGGQKKVGGSIAEHFTWWSAAFNTRPPEEEKNGGTEDTIKQVQDHLHGVIKTFADEDDDVQQLASQFATSDAFHPNPSRYGNVCFTYNIKDLCSFYENYTGEDVQFKVLGTFMYKAELMHAVLVCGVGAGNTIFKDYPDVPQPTSPEGEPQRDVVTRDEDGDWLWNPQAIATVITRLKSHGDQYPRFRRWEHVAFAFHLKSEDDCMGVANLTQHKETI